MALVVTYLIYFAVLLLFIFYTTNSRMQEFDSCRGVECKNQTAPLVQALTEFTTTPSTLSREIRSSPKLVKNRAPNFYRGDSNHDIHIVDPDVFEGVKARSFKPWQGEIPCFEPESDWKNNGGTPSREGILFTKPMKTGSSTAAGITLRVARNVAQRRGLDYPICKARFDHAMARDSFSDRIRNKSFLWTVVRDPTDRIVSMFYHFWVSRFKKKPTDFQFKKFVKLNIRDWVGDHYQSWLSPQPNGSRLRRRNKAAFNNNILDSYNFIAVTERMDESAVALAMLLNVPLADVLYLSSKINGGLDDGGHENTCVKIQPSHVSPGMKEFFQTEEYQNIVHWDHVLYQAANRSLDLTIDTLGRQEFEKNLALYQKAQELAVQRCVSKTVFPCSESGAPPREKTDCLWSGSGCGYLCLDGVATELGLWGPSGPPRHKERAELA